MDHIFSNRACPLCGVMPPEKKAKAPDPIINETQLCDDIREKLEEVIEQDRYLNLFPNKFDVEQLKNLEALQEFVNGLFDVVSTAMCDFFLRERGGLKF